MMVGNDVSPGSFPLPILVLLLPFLTQLNVFPLADAILASGSIYRLALLAFRGPLDILVV